MPSLMRDLAVPDRLELHKVLGRFAIAHTHLELMLRYCVKTIAKQSLAEALDATEGERISDLRIRIKQLFKERRPTALEKISLMRY
jgi:hypothetical protein